MHRRVSFREFRSSAPIFRAAAEGLLAGGVDLISLETMTGLSEALSALRAVRRLTSQPVAVCMMFRRWPAGFRSFWDEPADLCAQTLLDSGADVIGANCMDGNDMISLTVEWRRKIIHPILVQPNAGRPIWSGGHYEYPTDANALVCACLAVRQAGASALGGCCGTTPGFIRALREALPLHKKSTPP